MGSLKIASYFLYFFICTLMNVPFKDYSFVVFEMNAPNAKARNFLVFFFCSFNCFLSFSTHIFNFPDNKEFS